jgi:hypothetical protein
MLPCGPKPPIFDSGMSPKFADLRTNRKICAHLCIINSYGKEDYIIFMFAVHTLEGKR